VAVEDALGRLTALDWCSCGSLSSLTDALGRVTSWSRDLRGRATEKIYPDGTITAYLYETNSSRLKQSTDAKGQITQYQYFTDDNLKQVTYTNAQIATPSVSFAYDTNYSRLLSMTDGVGTTAYAYHPITSSPSVGAGQLASVDGPLSNDTISYDYDALGRVLSRAVNGVAVRAGYDILGRIATLTNVLGTFTNSYVSATARLSAMTYPNGQTTTLSYQSNTNDKRLQTIWHKNASAATISKFDYAYDAEGLIKTWTHQADSSTPTEQSFEYDPVNQLLGGTVKNTVTQSILRQFLYGYDKAGNRTSEQIDLAVTSASPNNLNQSAALHGGGPVRFSGTLNELGVVTIDASSTTFDSRTTNFVGHADAASGTNVISLVAADYGNNSATNHYQIVVTNSNVTKTLAYDLNGNLISAITENSTNSYDWDAANRLVKITQLSIGSLQLISEFSYDGTGRRVRTIERTNAVVQSDNRSLWGEAELCEERDSTGAIVTKRFLPQGAVISGTNYFFTRDHLGSILEVTDGSGALQARYAYDPYGRRTKVSGSLEADFGFTGHYYHAVSALHLALFRAYDSGLGRWLSRDPLGELGGMNEPQLSIPSAGGMFGGLGAMSEINLYAYVGGNPVNFVDPFGLISWSCFGKGVVRGVLGGAAVAGLAAFAVGLGAPIAVVTLGLAASAAIGTVLVAKSAYNDRSEANWSYLAGNLTGGLLFGFRVSRPLANATSPPRSRPAPGPVGRSDQGKGIYWTGQGKLRDIYDANKEGPTIKGAGGATTLSAGVAAEVRIGAGCY
jgi:RHS repeat-associated protein